jgi:hypothetical protein
VLLQDFVSHTLRELNVELWAECEAEVDCCEALLAADFLQLQVLRLRWGDRLGWLRTAKGDLSGFPNLTRLAIATGGFQNGDVLLDDLDPIITSGKDIEELELDLGVSRPLYSDKSLVDLACEMPWLTQLTYNRQMVKDSLELQQAAERAGTAVLLVNFDELEEKLAQLQKNEVSLQGPPQQPASSGEEDEYGVQEEGGEGEDEEEDRGQ